MSATMQSKLAPWAGLLGGLFAWFLGEQLGAVFVGSSCEGQRTPLYIVNFATALLALACIAVSWRAWRGGEGDLTAPGTGNRRFIALISAGLGGLFLLAILGQILAGFVFTGCER